MLSKSVPASPVKRNTTAKHSAPLAVNPDDQKQLTTVINYYHETLKQGPEALDYLSCGYCFNGCHNRTDFVQQG